MRQTCIFSGSSHPGLVDKVCNWLGDTPGKVALGKFKNGETSVEIHTSVRDKNVFIVQSGSNKMNDMVMELLIMINACKGGSAKSVTAVIPYFPYSRQSKKKAHRSAITARMIANLMDVAGVNHVITIDLHASQMQGFFKCPVDNLVAEPILAKWIRNNIFEWRTAVVVSKNPGGTKRVTSLADALQLNFGIITTERTRMHMPASMYNSVVFNSTNDEHEIANSRRTRYHKLDEEVQPQLDLGEPATPIEHDYAPHPDHIKPSEYLDGAPDGFPRRAATKPRANTTHSHGLVDRIVNGAATHLPSPLAQSIRPGSADGEDTQSHSNEDHSSKLSSPSKLSRMQTAIETSNGSDGPESDDDDDEFTDERARNVITGRLVHGHLVDDDYPSPMLSAMTSSIPALHKESSDDGPGSPPDHMLNSFMSHNSSHRPDHGLGGTGDATASDDEEEEALKNPELETTITLVGNVYNRPVFIVDDIIDKPGSWIAAAETAVKRGGATKVYCMATHGLFGNNALREMQECDEIDRIIVTNSFPIPEEMSAGITKLTVLDVSHLLSEAIRRNAHGESISQLFMHLDHA